MRALHPHCTPRPAPGRPTPRPRRPAPPRRALPPPVASTPPPAGDTPAPPPAPPPDVAPRVPPTSSEWQLDFSSRPVLDERGKKRWELYVTDGERGWEAVRWFPNNAINSQQLKAALADILAMPGATPPARVRFFRGAMQTIITRAVTDLGLKPVPSRRTFALAAALEERAASVYPTLPGYSAAAPPPFGGFDAAPPAAAPDALRGEAWQFVQLPLADLAPELASLASGAAFGDAFDPAAVMGAAAPAADAPIPGLAIYTRRALPLAGWLAGYELAAVTADSERGCLVLETGVNTRWRYAALPPRGGAEEADAWEAAKAAVGGLHFLVVQADDESDPAGVWLLWDRAPVDV